MIAQFRRIIASLLIVSMASLGLPISANAGMLATDAALASPDRDRIVSLLERSEVQSRLAALGVSPADLKARVAALSDDEAAQLAAQIDSLPAGADGSGAVIGAIVLIFLVLLITDLLGWTKVFPFTRTMR